MLPEKPRYDKQAARLVDVAKIAAISSLVPLLDRLPALEQTLKGKPADAWDFVATVAGVGAGMLQAYRRIPESEIASAEEALRRALSAWDQRGYAAYLDFAGFVARNVDGGVDIAAAVGAWVIWNIKANEPTDRELSVAPIIGRLLGEAVINAWQ